MMFALMMTALFGFIAVTSIAMMADSGLRWWSAFGQLRRQLRNSVEYSDMPRARSYATPYRGTGACGGARKAKPRAAA